MKENEKTVGRKPAGKDTTMDKDTTIRSIKQPVTFENIETVIRCRIQGWMQEILEEEVTEFLGRAKSERRADVDAPAGYRNGHGKPRKLTLSSGTMELRRPRVRNLEERFESRVLPLFERRTPEVAELLPKLYLHGLACGDFDLALRGLLGDDAPLSASTVMRLKESWQGELLAWKNRRLDELEVVYVWADGVYVKAGLEKDKACVLVMIAALSDGSKALLAIESGYRESKESWSSVLRSLRDRGLAPPRAVVGDGALGLWSAIGNVWPETDELRCWNHRIMNILDRVKKCDQTAARDLLRNIAYAESRAQAEKAKMIFVAWCTEKGYAKASELMGEDWERMVAFFGYPKEHWQHLRTTNPVESPFSSLRLRTDAARRFKKVDNAIAVVWKMLLVAESRFRKLNAPELMAEVYRGVKFRDGVRVREEVEAQAVTKKRAAA